MFAFRKSDRAAAGAAQPSQVLQVAVLWGDDAVLYEASLSPPRAFSVGDAEPAAGGAAPDFAIGAETLGTGTACRSR